MNNKGFTLVELLAVIVILAIILLVAVPNVLNVIERSKEDSYLSSTLMIENAAELYLISNNSELPSDIGTEVRITLNELLEEDYLTSIPVDPRNNEEMDTNLSVVITKISNNEYTYDFESYVQVTVGTSGDYTNIQDALDADEKNILILDGTYNITDHILIANDDVVLKGESKENVIIIQQDPADDGVVVRGDYVTVENLTINTMDFDAKAAFVEGDANYVTLKDTIIYGPSDTFAIFFAGKTHSVGDDTLAAVENNDLDSNNTMIDNTIYSTWDGDSISFSLQKYGYVARNEIIGAKLAIYMTRDTLVEDNIITDSASQGIYYSTPAYDNTIINNTINNALQSGIKIATQYEHPIDTDYRATGLILEGNTVNGARYLGIEINQLRDSLIQNNNINTIDAAGIFLLRVENTDIINNEITNVGFGVTTGSLYGWSDTLCMGIMLDYDVSDVNITGNNIYNNDPDAQMAFAIKVMPNTNNENFTISNNTLYGDAAIYVNFESNGNHTEFLNNIY